MISNERELKTSTQSTSTVSANAGIHFACKLVPALILLAALSMGMVQAQDSFQGMVSDLEGMERQLQTPSNPAASLVQRLTNMEMHLFGAQKTGSMIDRLNALKAAMPQQGNQFRNSGPIQNSNQIPNGGNQFQNGNQNQSNSGFSQSQQFAPGSNQERSSGAMPNNFNHPNSTNIENNKFHENLNAGEGWIPGSNNVTGVNTFHGGRMEAPTPPQQSSMPSNAMAPNMTPAPVKGWQAGVMSKQEKKHPKQSSSGKQSKKEDDTFPATADSRTMPQGGNFQPANLPQGSQPLVSTPLPVPGAGLIKKNYSPDALPLLNGFPPNLVRMDPDNTALIARPDYYDEVHKASKGKNIRYKNLPVPVYIQPFPDKAFVNCVLRAFESWEMRTNGVIKFVQTDNPNQARIQVVWKHLGGNRDGSGCLLGAHTILKYTNNGNGNLSIMNVGAVPVPIYIPRLGPKYTVPPQVMEVNLDLINVKEQSVKYPCLQNIVTHELGHALGMLGHSPNQTDIMYPVTDEHSRLSQRDINTVIKLYNQKCEMPL